METAIKSVKTTVLAITVSIWAIVGFFFWVPMLARAVAVFSAAVVHSALTHQDPGTAARFLDIAITFYIRGFRQIVDVINSPVQAHPGAPKRIHALRFLFELAWAGVFWVVTILALRGELGGMLQWLVTTIRSALM